MNDRFKFRAYNTESKKIYDVRELGFMRDTLELGDICLEKPNNDAYGIEIETVDEYIVLQCTGLKDKNGKLIYEGDIVNWVLPRKDKDVEENYIIVWNEKYANFTCKKRNGDIMPQIFSQPDLRAKVIGNIYENPELLEEK